MLKRLVRGEFTRGFPVSPVAAATGSNPVSQTKQFGLVKAELRRVSFAAAGQRSEALLTNLLCLPIPIRLPHRPSQNVRKHPQARAAFSTSNSAPGEDGSKPCSISQRAATRLRHDHHARIRSMSTSVP